MCLRLQMTPGDFAVVIHGDRDCANVLFSGMDFPGIERFFCTSLGEAEAVTGKSTARLEECLELVCREGKVKMVFLLGTCLSTLIGDQPGDTALRVSERNSIPIVTLSGAGMRFMSQASICDRFARLMLDACAPADCAERTVNLVGFYPGAEVISLLGELGITVNSVLDLHAPLSAWKALGQASHNLVLDPELFAGFIEAAERKFGQTTVLVPYPVGYRSTAGFFESVLRAVSPATGANRLLATHAEPARTAVQQARDRLRGSRLGYNIGSLKNLDPRSLAREGLTDLPVFEELGFEPVILVQGDDHPERITAVRETLSSFGYGFPVEVFSDTVFFEELCRTQRCDLVYAADYLKGGPGFMPIGSLAPGFSGVPGNLGRIQAVRNES
jgi:nitrogenase molybdenum-iron protein alpha/beta subunit